MTTKHKQAPLPPNGTRNRYAVEVLQQAFPLQSRYYAVPLGNSGLDLATAKAWLRYDVEHGYTSRITTRLADGRKLVIGGDK